MTLYGVFFFIECKHVNKYYTTSVVGQTACKSDWFRCVELFNVSKHD